jgi:hypothetical protein
LELTLRNPLHGLRKEHLFGLRDHINIAGYKHVDSAAAVLRHYYSDRSASWASVVVWPPLVVLRLGSGFGLHVPKGRPQRRRHVCDQLRLGANAQRARVHHETVDPDGAG